MGRDLSMAYEEREKMKSDRQRQGRRDGGLWCRQSAIGSIERVMIDKISGKVAYAVLGFGGFLGMGDDYYPLPWQSLKYDTNLGGYIAGISDGQPRGAPKYSTRAAGIGQTLRSPVGG